MGAEQKRHGVSWIGSDFEQRPQVGLRIRLNFFPRRDGIVNAFN